MDFLTHSHILIALDPEDPKEKIGAIFRNQGCDPIFVETQEDIIDSLDIVKFDLLLVTLHAPDSERFETIKKIRAQEQASTKTRLPIMGIVASTARINELAILRSGIDQYITSPYAEHLLIETIARLIKTSTTEHSPALEFHADHLPVLNKEDFIDRIGDEESFFKVGQVVLSLMPEWHEKMVADFTEKNAELLRQHAHSARGAFADLGAQRAAYVLACIEKSINEQCFNDWNGAKKAVDLIFQETQDHIKTALAHTNTTS